MTPQPMTVERAFDEIDAALCTFDNCRFEQRPKNDEFWAERIAKLMQARTFLSARLAAADRLAEAMQEIDKACAFRSEGIAFTVSKIARESLTAYREASHESE